MKRDIGKERIYSIDFEERNDVVQWDVLNIKKEQYLVLRFISTNSKYSQGVRIAVDVGDGYIEINNEKAKGMKFWEDMGKEDIYFKCYSPEGLVSIYNVWSKGKESESLSYKSGMLLEKSGNKITYRCNDFGDTNNFDKLVFEIELL